MVVENIIEEQTTEMEEGRVVEEMPVLTDDAFAAADRERSFSIDPEGDLTSEDVRPVTISNRSMDNFLKSFGRGVTKKLPGGGEAFESTTTIMAKQIGGELALLYPTLIDYKGLRDGTSRWFDTKEFTKNKLPKNRRFSDDQILTVFAEDEEGRPLAGKEMNTIWEGFKRQIIPSTSGLVSMVAGAKAGAKVPGSPLTKLLSSIGLGTLGLLGGDYGAKRALEDFPILEELGIMGSGKERVFTPNQRSYYEGGKTLAAFTPYVMPKLYIPPTVDLGGGTLAKNILTNAEKIMEKFRAGGKLTKKDLKTPGVDKLLNEKYSIFSPFTKKGGNPVPFGTRLTAAVERMLTGYGKTARAQPYSTFALEGAAAIGATSMATLAEDAYPSQAGARILAEMTGAVMPTVFGPRLVANFLPKINSFVKTSVKEPFKVGGITDPGGVWETNKNSVKGMFKFVKRKGEKRTALNLSEALWNAGEDLGGSPTSKADMEQLFALLEAKTIKAREIALDRKMTPLEKENWKNRGSWSAADAAEGSPLWPLIVALQGAAEATSPGLAAKTLSNQQQVSGNYTAVIQKLVETGDPSLLRIASEMMYESFEVGHAAKIEKAVDVAVSAMERVKGTDPKTNKELGEKLFETINGILKEARVTEKTFWTPLDNIMVTEFRNPETKEVVMLPNFITRWKENLPQVKESRDLVKTQLRPLYEFVERMEQEFLDGAPVITLRDLREMRSVANSLARDNASNAGNQRLAGLFSSALYDDMASLPTGFNSAYDAALAYSRSLNDTFTRTYQGPLNSTVRGGAIKIPPEILASRLQTGSSDSILLRHTELEEVANFARENNLEGFDNRIVTLENTRNGILRNMLFKKVLDANTGELNPRALQNWLKDPVNQQMLDMPVFASLKEDLSDSKTATTLLKTVRKRKLDEDKILKNNISFLNFLPKNILPDGVAGVESVAKIVGMAIESKFPTASLNNLLAFVNGGKSQKVAGTEITMLTDQNTVGRKEAREALKSAILENSFLKSDVGSMAFSPSILYREIFESMSNTGLKRPGANVGGVSLADWMSSNKIMGEPEIKNIKNILEDMVKYEAMDAAGKLTNDVLSGDPNFALDLYLKLAGSKLGASAAGILGAGSDSLIVRSAGVRFLTTIIKDIPASMDMAFAGRLFEDPQFMATMIRAASAKNLGSREKRAIGARVIDFLSRYGFRETYPLLGSKSRETGENIIGPAVEQLEETFTGEGGGRQSSSVVLPNQEELRTSFLTRQLEQQPQSGNPPTNNFASSASGSGNAGTGFKQMSQEQKYAALFPNDASGIGSLMS